MKVQIKKYVVSLIVLTMIFTSFPALNFNFIPKAYAFPDTAVWYFRADQHTVNTVTGYVLNGTQTSTSKYVSLSSSGQLQTWVAIRVWVVFSDGNMSELTDGTYNVNVTRTSSGYGYQNVTWTCPETNLNTTDAIMVRIYLKVGSGDWTAKAKFITSQLNMSQISGNWTFQLYTKNQQTKNPITHQWTTACYFYWGSSSYNSLIDGVELLSGTPTPSNIQRSGDTALQLANFSAYWTCTSNLSHAILYIKPNDTATWDTYIHSFPEGTTEGWSNFSIVLPQDWETKYVEWYIWCNSTSGANSQTSTKTFYCWRHVPSAGYHSIGFTSGGARVSTYYNGSPNGVEAIFIAYLNSSAGTETWRYEIKAWSFDDYKWHGPYILGDSGHTDRHWNPSISVLPDGRLIVAYGYFSLIYFRISTYSAKTCSDIDQLIQNWGPTYSLSGVYSSNVSAGLCYPMPVRWNDTLLMFARDGSSYSGRWVFWRWVNQSVVDVYPKEFDNSTWGSGITYDGWNPYLDERYKLYNGYFKFTAKTSTTVGKWTFRKGYAEWNASTGKLKILCNGSVGDSWATITPIVSGTTLTEKDVPTSTDWLEWDVNGLTWNDTLEITVKIGYYANYVYILSIKLELNITGFGSAYTLGEKPSGDSYYVNLVPQGNRLYVCMRKHSYPVDFNLIYTDDKGYTWKLYNGTEIQLPFTSFDQTKVLDLNLDKMATYYAYESLGKAVLCYATWNYSKRDDATYVYVAEANGTFGQNIQFTIYNVTLENGEQLIVPKETNFGFQYDLYYERLAFWGIHNGTVGKFVCLPNNNTVFRQVYTQQGVWRRTNVGLIFYSPSAYEQWELELKLLLGNRILGNETQYIDSSTMVGAKFTVQTNGTLSAVYIYNSPNSTITGPNVYCKLALYNSTFHRIANASETRIISGKGLYGWRYAIAFPNPIEVHEGETYWIVFKINEASSNFEWGYAYKNEGINTTFHMPTNWNDQFPDQLNQSQMTFYNRTVTIVGVESKLVVRGLGVDIYPPSCVKKGAERDGTTVTFYAYWHEDIQLKNATFYWNYTGTMQQNGTVELTGVYAWSNFTRQVPAQTSIAWYIIACDTAGNVGNTSLQILTMNVYKQIINETVRFTDGVVKGGGGFFSRLLSVAETQKKSLTIFEQTYVSLFDLIFKTGWFTRTETFVILDGQVYEAYILKQLLESLSFAETQKKGLTVVQVEKVSLASIFAGWLTHTESETIIILDGQFYQASKYAELHDLLKIADSQHKSLTIIQKEHVNLLTYLSGIFSMYRTESFIIIDSQYYNVAGIKQEQLSDLIKIGDSQKKGLTVVKKEYVSPLSMIFGWFSSIFQSQTEIVEQNSKSATIVKTEKISLIDVIASTLKSLFKTVITEKPLYFSDNFIVKREYRSLLTVNPKYLAVLALIFALVALVIALEKTKK